MKLSVSNIAWAPDDTDTAYELLRDMGVTGLEVAPGLLFPGLEFPLRATQAQCDAARDRAAGYGLQFTSMQSLLYGAGDISLFGDSTQRQRLRETMGAVCALAGRLSIPNLVFGSPKNRIVPRGLSISQVRKIWLDSFRRFGDMAQAAGTILALEPNPVEYGTNFMTTLAETLDVAREVNHPAVRLNLDMGAMLLTGEMTDPGRVLGESLDMISHVHISVPYLEPVSENEPAVQVLLNALARHGYRHWVSIEMRQDLASLPGAIRACQKGQQF